MDVRKVQNVDGLVFLHLGLFKVLISEGHIFAILNFKAFDNILCRYLFSAFGAHFLIFDS